MIYKINGKKILIPDCDIDHYQKSMNLSKDEAVQIWLEDEGYLENEEQNALCQKAKDNRITATIHKARNYEKKTQKERVKKDDPTKEGIIKALAEYLETLNATDIVIVNSGKLITFKVGTDNFKLDLIRQRPPKEK